MGENIRAAEKKLHHPPLGAQADIGNGETYLAQQKSCFQGIQKMKVIFLDVDGVLNSEECLDVPEQSSEYLYDASTIVPLLKRCVDNLHEICEATPAKVVVSSTWRLFPDMLAFLTRVVGDDLMLGVTKDRGAHPIGPGRGEEVRQWLQEHKEVTKFIILDDEHKESFESSLFRDRKPPHESQGLLITTAMRGTDFTDFEDLGLTRAHVQQTVNFFKQQ